MSYGDLCTQFYDLDKPTAPADEVDFFASLCLINPGPVLEPMCGSGRLLIPLAKRGVDIEGFDLSTSMLEACNCKAKTHSIEAPIAHASFETFTPDRQYAVILIALGSIGLLTHEVALRQALTRIYAWLEPGGLFAFDVDLCHHKESFSWPTGGRWLKTPDGDVLSLHWTGHYTHEDQVAHSLGRYELIRNGQIIQTEVELQEVKLFTPKQIVGLIREVGFSSVNIEGFHGLDVDTETAETLTCIAKK